MLWDENKNFCTFPKRNECIFYYKPLDFEIFIFPLPNLNAFSCVNLVALMQSLRHWCCAGCVRPFKEKTLFEWFYLCSLKNFNARLEFIIFNSSLQVSWFEELKNNINKASNSSLKKMTNGLISS